MAAYPLPQFVQLQVREVQLAKEALVQGMRMLACTRQPSGNSRLPVAEDSLGSGSVQPFGQCRQHDGDMLGRGFQPVQGVLRRAVNVVRQA